MESFFSSQFLYFFAALLYVLNFRYLKKNSLLQFLKETLQFGVLVLNTFFFLELDLGSDLVQASCNFGQVTFLNLRFLIKNASINTLLFIELL